jgi:hypothetical protein
MVLRVLLLEGLRWKVRNTDSGLCLHDLFIQILEFIITSLGQEALLANIEFNLIDNGLLVKSDNFFDTNHFNTFNISNFILQVNLLRGEDSGFFFCFFLVLEIIFKLLSIVSCTPSDSRIIDVGIDKWLELRLII